MTEGPLIIDTIEATKREVTRRLDICQIPQNAIVVGELWQFMRALQFSVVDPRLHQCLSLQEFEGVLRALSERGLDFVGSTLLPNPWTDSKVDAALGSHYARLPYPETYFIEGSIFQRLHSGYPRLYGITGRAVVKRIPSQGGDSVNFEPLFDPVGWAVPSEGRYIYMQEVNHTRENERTRDSRIAYWPHQPFEGYGVKDVVFVADRVGGSDMTNIAQGGEWQGTILPTQYINGILKDYLTVLSAGVLLYSLKFAFREEEDSTVLSVYESAGIKASNGLYGIDIVYPFGDYPNKSSAGSTPVALELHDCFNLPEKGFAALQKYLLGHLRRQRRPVVMFRNRHMISPILLDELGKDVFGVRRIPVLVEDRLSRRSGNLKPFLNFQDQRSSDARLARAVRSSIRKVIKAAPH